MKFLCCEAVQKGLGCKARDGRSFDYAAQDRLGRGVSGCTLERVGRAHPSTMLRAIGSNPEVDR